MPVVQHYLRVVAASDVAVMTNKTVTMSRELIEKLQRSAESMGWSIADDLSAALDAPAVESQEHPETDDTFIRGWRVGTKYFGLRMEAVEWIRTGQAAVYDADTKLHPLYFANHSTSPPAPVAFPGYPPVPEDRKLPAPVAVVLPDLTDEQRDIEVTEMAEFMNHLSGGLRHFAGYLIDAGWRKHADCLDKVKELNQ